MRQTLRDIWVLYARETRAALREKMIVVNSILIPVFLYPFLFWAMFTGITFVLGQTEGFTSRVVVQGWPDGHPQLRRAFDQDERLELVEAMAGEEAARQLRDGELDALVELLPPPPEGAILAGNFSARVTANTSRERSEEARKRVTSLLERYRADWLRRQGGALGLADRDWLQFTIESRNVASSEEMGAFLLGLLLPLTFVIMVAIGCFYPAVDATAGERERNTWETSMGLAVPRSSLVIAKYLHVATFGCMAGLLNVVALTFSMRGILSPLLAREGGDAMEFTMPLAAVPVMAVGAALLAGFVAAGMMIFASFARTFKEGQSMVTPFYLIVMIPVMFLQVPGLEFTMPLALIPVVNVAMMVREAISGVFHWPQIVTTMVVEVATIAGCLALATMILRFEDVVMGSYGGSFGKFLKERLLRSRAQH